MSTGRKEGGKSKQDLIPGLWDCQGFGGDHKFLLLSKGWIHFSNLSFVCVHSPGKGTKSGTKSIQLRGLNPSQRDDGTWANTGRISKLLENSWRFLLAAIPWRQLLQDLWPPPGSFFCSCFIPVTGSGEVTLLMFSPSRQRGALEQIPNAQHCLGKGREIPQGTLLRLQKLEKDSDPIPALLIPSGFSHPAAPPALWDV